MLQVKSLTPTGLAGVFTDAARDSGGGTNGLRIKPGREKKQSECRVQIEFPGRLMRHEQTRPPRPCAPKMVASTPRARNPPLTVGIRLATSGVQGKQRSPFPAYLQAKEE